MSILPDSRRVIIVVLGMHRSGTSAITRGLMALGVNLGERLMPASATENPTGYWEDLDVYELDRRMLNAISNDWHRLSAVSDADCSELERRGFDRLASDILRDRSSGGQIYAFKDPRVARLLPFWERVFEQNGFDVRYVVALRNPLSVARSLSRRNRMDHTKAYLLWLCSMLPAIQSACRGQFVVVDYDRMMRDPAGQLRRIGAALDLCIDDGHLSRYVEEFLDPDLQHHQCRREELASDPLCPPLVLEVYELLDSLAETAMDAPGAIPILERIVGWLSELKRYDAVWALVDRFETQIETQREEAQQGAHYRDELTVRMNQGLAEAQLLRATIEEENQRYAALEASLAILRSELLVAHQTGNELNQRVDALQQLCEQRGQEIADANAQAVWLQEQVRAAQLHAEALGVELRGEQATVEALLRSTSWRITFPLRTAREHLSCLQRIARTASSAVDPWRFIRQAYHSLPVRHEHRERIKSAMYRRFPRVFGRLPSYRIWETQQRLLSQLVVAAREGRDVCDEGVPSASSITIPVSLTPLVSIVIPVYGKIDFTLRCLASIARHPPALPFEIIIVDDCSGDDSAATLRQCAGVTLLQNQQNMGFIASCNRGADAAAGDYLCFLNNDTEVSPGWLEELHACFAQFPLAAIAGSKLVYPDGRLQEAGGILWRDGTAWNYGRGEHPAEPRFNYARVVDYCSGASIMISRTLFHRLGGFDDAYAPAYGEDSDLALKARALGMQVIYQPLSVVLHHEGVTCGTGTDAGVKRFQLENTRKLAERWADLLAQQHAPATDVDAAKDRDICGRVLVLDHRTPTPDRDAGSLTALNLMLLLRQAGLQVTFAPEDSFLFLPEYTPMLQRAGIETLYAPWVRSVREHLAEAGGRYDAVLLIRPKVVERHLRDLRRYCPRAKVLYHASDLHFLRLGREADVSGSDTTRLAADKMRATELALMRQVDCVIVHSSVERDLLASDLGAAPVHVFQWAISVNGTQHGFAKRRDIGFVGGYEHEPNVDAVKHFLSDIFPLLRAELPGLRFLAIGSNPPPELLALASDSVEVTGFVENLGLYLDRIRVAVAPLRIGAGIKGKIGTSLSVGLPCVASTVAVEGMGLREGEEILVADDPQCFADRVLRLYRDEDLWRRLSQNGIAFAERTYGLPAAEDSIRTILRSVGLHVPDGRFAHKLASPVARERTPREAAGESPLARPLQPVAILAGAADFARAHLSEALRNGVDAGLQLCGDGQDQQFTVYGYCVPCGKRVPFLVDMMAGGRFDGQRWLPNWRERLECPLCRMNNRQRLIATLLWQVLQSGPAKADIYLMEQVTPIFTWVLRQFPQHTISGSEYLGHAYRGGEVVRGLRHEDVTALSFKDNSLDVILSNDVFEHVSDPWAGFRECARVLRPGGTLLFTVPFDPGSEQSLVRARLVEDRVQHLLPPVFHGNPVSTEGSLVFTDFGWDLLARVADSGFAMSRGELFVDAMRGHVGEAQILFRAQMPPR